MIDSKRLVKLRNKHSFRINNKQYDIWEDSLGKKSKIYIVKYTIRPLGLDIKIYNINKKHFVSPDKKNCTNSFGEGAYLKNLRQACSILDKLKKSPKPHSSNG